MNNQYLKIRDQRFGLPFVKTDPCVGVMWSRACLMKSPSVKIPGWAKLLESFPC